MPQPEEQDYPARRTMGLYLNPTTSLPPFVASLTVAPIQHREAKDILRAAGLVLLPEDNAPVASDLKKIKEGRNSRPSGRLIGRRVNELNRHRRESHALNRVLPRTIVHRTFCITPCD